jgi:hypothetical protein
VAVVAVLALALPSLAPTPATAGLLGPTTEVIVTGPAVATVVALVSSVGGQVVADLSLINGVVAEVPSLALNLLDAVPGLVVSPDAAVSVADASFGSVATPTRAPAAVFP